MSQSQSQSTQSTLGKKRKSTFTKRVKTDTPLTLAQTKAVARIAKSVALSTAETKSLINNNSQTCFNDLIYCQNLNFSLTQGITGDRIIGEKLFVTNFHIRMNLAAINSVGATNEPVVHRILLIRSKKALSAGGPTVLAGGDIFRGTIGNVACNGLVDLHEVDLLMDETVCVPTHIANTNTFMPFSKVVKINRTHYVDEDNGGYFKDKNYYLIFTAQKQNILIAANVASATYQWTMNFKDS